MRSPSRSRSSNWPPCSAQAKTPTMPSTSTRRQRDQQVQDVHRAAASARQAQRVAARRAASCRHAEPGGPRRQPAHERQRHAGQVVGARPRRVLAQRRACVRRASVARRDTSASRFDSSTASACARAMRAPCAHRERHVGLREHRRIVDAVADHRRRAAPPRLRRAHRGELVARAWPPPRRRRCPARRATAATRAGASPDSSVHARRQRGAGVRRPRGIVTQALRRSRNAAAAGRPGRASAAAPAAAPPVRHADPGRRTEAPASALGVDAPPGRAPLFAHVRHVEASRRRRGRPRQRAATADAPTSAASAAARAAVAASSCTRRRQRAAIAMQREPRLGQRAGLVEEQRVARAPAPRARRAAQQHAAPRQRAGGREQADGAASDSAHGQVTISTDTATHTARAGSIMLQTAPRRRGQHQHGPQERRRPSGRPRAQRAGAASARSRISATMPRSAYRRRRARRASRPARRG